MIANAKSTAPGQLLSYCLDSQAEYERLSTIASRKKKGQFFTPLEISRFMADLVAIPALGTFRLLDPGAGVGGLTAAICDRFLGFETPRNIELHLFENDPDVLPFLRKVMRRCSEAMEHSGYAISCEIHEKDFILDAAATIFGPPSLFDAPGGWSNFDAVIMNPPYFKLNKLSPYAQVMNDVVHGQPNIYSFFLSAAAEMLRPAGTLVAITPRSFCNGLYFREFRRWFFKRMALDRIHLFESRTEAFRDVLQESLITAFHRLGAPSATVTVTSSYGPNLKTARPRELPTASIVDNSCGQEMIRIPAGEEDTAITEVVESWPGTFSDLGYRISTGPVVMFRAKEFLSPDLRGADITPLLSVFNVKPFHTEWPVAQKRHPAAFKICKASRHLLLPTQNYVLLRRFSAKEERRRLTASCLLASEVPQKFLAVENHLNYVYHAERELSVDEVYGLAGMFNSSLLDRYFRTISGNTQVNATEIRNMRFPPLLSIANIGSKMRELSSLDHDAIELIVLKELGISHELGQHLLTGTLFSQG
jgi:adenine-specific DNA-methyltransferase